MKKLSSDQLRSVKNWTYRNARPLDLARWEYFLYSMRGSGDDVLRALSVYQNADGGFGHALEPDMWNPDSSPIQTWYATQFLDEIGMEDATHPIIRGIVNYFSTIPRFGDNEWRATVPSMNEHPHAPWWGHNINEQPQDKINYKPTAAIVGFLIRFSDENTQIYQTACDIARKIYNQYMKSDLTDDMLAVQCLIQMCEYISVFQNTVIDTDALRAKLIEQVKFCITKNTDEWLTGYVCTPSVFVRPPDSVYASGIRDYIEIEANMMIDTLSDDGTWNIPWSWGNYTHEWEISKNWWKADKAVNNMRFLLNFGRI